jgi:hypothetical protein
MKKMLYEKLVAHVNRKSWWHVRSVAPDASRKRGKLLASSFEATECYGSPLDELQKVKIESPLVGDERAIARALHISPEFDGMTLEQIAAHDAKWRNAALKKSYDAILLMLPKCLAEWEAARKIRSLELNILNVSVSGGDLSRRMQ